MKNRMLTIINSKNQLHEVVLLETGKPTVVIGRNEQMADVVIEDNFVARYHGEFFEQNNQLYYRNTNTSNGTFIEQYGKRIHLNKQNEVTVLAEHAILRIGNPNNARQMVVILIGHNLEGNSKWKEVSLQAPSTTIGRSRECSIVLNHPGVSRIHAQISHDGNQYILHTTRAINGLLLNGQNVEKDRVLREKDIIGILNYQLIFSKGSLFYKEVAEGLSLSVSHITKTVGTKGGTKQILTDVSLDIGSNEFVAIVGGSGAGKTTLMNAISGFEPEFDGHVFCNGVDLVSHFQVFKNMIGYVPQQDIIYDNLSLRRMLEYTGRLKMPKDMSQQEIDERIDKVLQMVDLQNHQDTFIRKLSGGQKKRASIAVELLADPKLFFLDEPTSGLDPGTERNLMMTLQSLAKGQNKTVIMVTHTTLNLHLCDKIIFMNPKGRLSFCGNMREALQFFETDDLVNVYNLMAEDPDYWENKYRLTRNDPQTQNGNGHINYQKEKTGVRQYLILTQRYFELMVRDPQRLAILLAQPVLIAILLKIVADDDIFTIYESTKSILFSLVCSAIWIGLFNSIQEICKERVIVKREYMGNMKLSNYILSKVTVQSVLGLVQAFLLSFCFLFLTDADKEGLLMDPFHFEIFLTVWITILAAMSFGLLISSIAKSGDKAMTVAPFVLIVQLLFSGILFKLEGIGEKISYLTMSRWSVEALGSIAHLNDLDLRMQADFPMLEHEAEDFFEATVSHLLKDWMILLVMGLLLLVLCGLSMRNISKDRR